MKKIALLLFAVMVAVSCSTTKKAASSSEVKTTENISFEYEALTRGTYKKVVVTKDSIVTIKDHSMKDVVTKTTGKKDWDQLVGNAAKVNLEGLKDIKAPWVKHQFDGALAANLKIMKDGKEYRSVTFDHGMPPAEIALLVKHIIAISDLNTK